MCEAAAKRNGAFTTSKDTTTRSNQVRTRKILGLKPDGLRTHPFQARAVVLPVMHWVGIFVEVECSRFERKCALAHDVLVTMMRSKK